MTRIKHLPLDIQKLALKNMMSQREYMNNDEVLGSAFLWSDSNEGRDFWKKISDEYDAKYIDVKDSEEVVVDSVTESIVSKFRERSNDMADLDRKEWIEQAIQKSMDFILYLERLKKEL